MVSTRVCPARRGVVGMMSEIERHRLAASIEQDGQGVSDDRFALGTGSSIALP